MSAIASPLIAAGAETLFTFTTTDRKTYVGYFAAGHSSTLTITDETGNRMEVKAEDISSVVLSRRKAALSPCSFNKALLTLTDKTKTIIEGCFYPISVDFIAGKLSMNVNTLTGTFVRKTD